MVLASLPSSCLPIVICSTWFTLSFTRRNLFLTASLPSRLLMLLLPALRTLS